MKIVSHSIAYAALIDGDPDDWARELPHALIEWFHKSVVPYYRRSCWDFKKAIRFAAGGPKRDQWKRAKCKHPEPFEYVNGPLRVRFRVPELGSFNHSADYVPEQWGQLVQSIGNVIYNCKDPEAKRQWRRITNLIEAF